MTEPVTGSRGLVIPVTASDLHVLFSVENVLDNSFIW